MLIPGAQHSDSIFLQNISYGKSSYLSPYKDITVLLSIFHMSYISSSWLIYIVTGSLYLLLSTYCIQPTTPSLTAITISSLYLLFSFFHLLFFRFHI